MVVGHLHYQGVLQGAQSKPASTWTVRDAIEGAYDGPAYKLILRLIETGGRQ